MKKIYFCLVKPSMAIALLAILTRILNLQCRSNDGTTHRSQTPSCFCLNKKSDAAVETSTSEVCYYLYCRHRMTGACALKLTSYFLLIHDWMTYDFYPRHAWAQWLLSTSDGLRKACSPAQLTINLLSMSFRLIQLVCVTKKWLLDTSLLPWKPHACMMHQRIDPIHYLAWCIKSRSDCCLLSYSFLLNVFSFFR